MLFPRIQKYCSPFNLVIVDFYSWSMVIVYLIYFSAWCGCIRQPCPGRIYG